MAEGLQNVTGPKTESDHTVESVALAGAAAIQRIIADRDGLRTWASNQQRELVGLRAANDELRRRLLMIRQHYLEFATQILGQFEVFDAALTDALKDSPTPPKKDDTLIDLVQRLSPVNRSSKT